VGPLDDPEATAAIVTLCIVGRSLDEEVADVCAEAVRRGCTTCTVK
jgi:hypothetical protein